MNIAPTPEAMIHKWWETGEWSAEGWGVNNQWDSNVGKNACARNWILGSSCSLLSVALITQSVLERFLCGILVVCAAIVYQKWFWCESSIFGNMATYASYFAVNESYCGIKCCRGNKATGIFEIRRRVIHANTVILCPIEIIILNRCSVFTCRDSRAAWTVVAVHAVLRFEI